MAGIAGNAASVKIGSNPVLEMGEWSADIERAIEDDTEFGDTWESGVATLGKASGSMKGRWGADATQQAALQNACLNGTTVSLKLYVNGTNNYTGTAYITKCSPSASVKGLVEMEYSFQFTGAVTYA